jgi:antitoxin YefM
MRCHNLCVEKDAGSKEIAFIVTYSYPVHRGDAYMLQTTYTNARANFAGLCNEAAENREIVMIRRRKGGDVALVAADELQGLLETAHLLRSPNNATRLLHALDRALKREERPTGIKELRMELGLEG